MGERVAGEQQLLDALENADADADAGSPADVVALMIASFLPLIGADAGFVATLSENGETIEVSRVTPHSKTPVRLTFPIDAPYPLAEVMRKREPIYIANNEQLHCDHPGLVRVEEADHACATLPLTAEDGCLVGALNLGYEDPHEFTPDERKLIELVGRRCSRAMTDLRDRV
jgi:GAF domain-containing protein